jgi:ribosomal protein S18 acetylase RimI-like enzyme
MKIIEITEYSDHILKSINGLLPQLSESAKPVSAQKLKKIISAENIHLFFAEEEGNYIGMLTLVFVHIPTQTKALIEEVVVDKNFLGKGIVKELTKHAITFAKKMGGSSVNLTSSPWRTAANALYKKLGFEKRETNVYKLGI